MNPQPQHQEGEEGHRNADPGVFAEGDLDSEDGGLLDHDQVGDAADDDEKGAEKCDQMPVDQMQVLLETARPIR